VVFDGNVFPFAVQPLQSSTLPSTTVSLPISVPHSNSATSTPIRNSAHLSGESPISNPAEPDVATTTNLSQFTKGSSHDYK
jgi:hypothetical protein